MNKTIPIFFACDDIYMPFLGVAVRSLIDNSSADNNYIIHVLNLGISEKYKSTVLEMATDNVTIKFVEVNDKIGPLLKYPNLRDYYTIAIYFRIFIPAMFPEYDKAIYLDSDIVVLDDIAKMFDIELGNNLVGGISDDIIASRKEFIDYAERGVGIPYREYFNSGVMLMNLKGMRDMGLEEKFIDLLQTYNFQTVCPDQDYLNVICSGRVLMLDKGWNKMSIDMNYEGKPHLIHYNMFNKPWQYEDVCYGNYFWEYAKKTDLYEQILTGLKNFSEDDKKMQLLGVENLVKTTIEIVNSEKNFAKVLFSKAR